MNYLAIFVTGIVNMLLGYLYYLPSIFGNKWAAFVGMNQDQMGKYPWYEIVIGVGLTFIQAFAIAWLLRKMNITTVGEALKAGFIVWAGIVVVSSLSWFTFQKGTEMFLINNLYYLISFSLMFTILAVWK